MERVAGDPLRARANQQAVDCGDQVYPDLSDETAFRAHFVHAGFIVVRNAVLPDVCDRAVTAFQREVLHDRHALFERHASGDHERHVYTEAGFMRYPIMNLQDIAARRHQDFRRRGLELLTQPAIRRAIRILCGEPGRVIHTMYFDGNQETWPHRDCHYIDSSERGRMIGVWVAAEDIHPDAGRFYVLSGSHRMTIPGEEDDPNGTIYKRRMAEFVQTGPLLRVAPVLAKGDMLLWSARTIHGSLPTTRAQHPRRSFTAHYIPASQKCRWQVHDACPTRAVRVNGVDIMLHAPGRPLLAWMRHHFRSEFPRCYEVVRTFKQRLTA